MDSYDILVIFLSVALGVLLVISIVFMVQLVKLANHIRSIVEKAESVMDNVEAVGEFFRKSAGPVAVSKIVANIFESYSNAKKGKKDGKK